jgi:5-methylcytosine-specific restriction endonuclease McrA
MGEIHQENFHPGEQLRLVLEEITPYNPTEQHSFIARTDNFLRSEGNITQIFYHATIDYILRRLIRTAQYFDRLIIRNNLPDSYLWTKIREFIQYELNVPNRFQEKIVTLLIECVQMSKRDPTQKTKDRVRQRAASQGTPRCYLCGRMVSDIPNLPESATVDHVWPQSLGGPSEDFNLLVACRRCNEAKDEHLRAEDFHYEKMALQVDEDDDNSFSTSFGHDFQVAASLRYNGRCYQCYRPLRYRGEAKYARLNSHDSWHFLNVAVFCAEHASQ